MSDSLNGSKRRTKAGVVWALVLLLVMGLVAGGLYFFVLGDNFHRVGDSDVYRSALLDREALQRRVRENGIRSVLSLLGKHPEAQWYRDQQQLLADVGVGFTSLDFNEYELPGRNRLLTLLHQLETLPRPLLVHCLRGADRSGMAALMLRLLEPGTSLEDAGREVSLWRRAFFEESVGKQLLRQYARWLDAGGKTHSPERFRRFLSDHYVDDADDVQYLLRFVNGLWLKSFAGGQVALLPGTALTLDGWAFDPQLGRAIRDVRVLQDATEVAAAETGLDSSQLVEREPDMGRSGWRATWVPAPDPRCSAVSLRFTREDGRRMHTGQLFRLCVDP